MTNPYASVDAMVAAARRADAFEGAAMLDVPLTDAPPTGMSPGSENDRIQRERQSKAAALQPAVPKRVYCAHVQPCTVCSPPAGNPTVPVEERAAGTVEPSNTIEPAASTAKPTQRVVRTQRAAPSAIAQAGKPAHGHAPVVIDPVDALLTLLNACKTDAERVTLLASAPEDVRRQLATRLRYKTFIAETHGESEALDRDVATFTQSLDDAPDDAARLLLIRAADRQLVAEWRWHSAATEKDHRVRYMRLAGVGT